MTDEAILPEVEAYNGALIDAFVAARKLGDGTTDPASSIKLSSAYRRMVAAILKDALPDSPSERKR